MMRLKIAQFILVIVGLILIIFMLGEVAISMMPYSMAKSLAGKVSMYGEPHRFTESFFNKIKGQAFGIIGLLMILESCLFFFWKKIKNWIAENLPGRYNLLALWKSIILTRTEVVILFILISIGIIFRLIRMQGIMERDEVANLGFAQNPFLAVSFYLRDLNNHPFHSFLVSLVTKLFGDSYWAIRSIAFISGIFLVPLVFLIVRSIRSHQPLRNGWLAATIMAASPLCCHYSAQARGYTLQMLFGLLAWILFVQIYEGKRDLILMVCGICALAMWTIATSLYLFVGLVFAFSGGVVQGKIKAKDLLVFIIVTSILTLLLWSPVIIVSGIQIMGSPDWNPEVGGWAIVPFWQRFKNMKDIISLSLNGPAPWIVLITIFIGISAINWAWRWIGAGILLSIITISFIIPTAPWTRIWIFLIPLIAILIETGISCFLRSIKKVLGRPIIMIGGLCIIYIVIVLPQVLDYVGYKEITAFANQVAKQWSRGQTIAILVDKDRLLKNSPDDFSSIRYYNQYTVRYYLKRQGIPYFAFRWREHSESDSFWLICVQADGLPFSLHGDPEKAIKWDFVMGPYALAKHVTKNFLLSRLSGYL